MWRLYSRDMFSSAQSKAFHSLNYPATSTTNANCPLDTINNNPRQIYPPWEKFTDLLPVLVCFIANLSETSHRMANTLCRQGQVSDP